MKKKLTALLLTLCAAVFLAVPALAAGTTAAAATDAASATYVADTQQVLTAEQAEALNKKCADLTGKYQCAVYVVVTDEIENDDAYDDAKALYQKSQLGYGSEKSGILIYNAVGSRKYAVIAYGKGNAILTDYGREELIDDVLVPGLKSGDYNAAYSDSVDRIGEYMADNAAGTPYDVNAGDDDDAESTAALIWVVVVFVVPLVIALIVCLVFKAQMKTAVEATEADDYLLRDQFHVTAREDHFRYQTVTVVHHDNDNDSGSGGTSIDSDGFSGSSGSY